MRLNFYRMVCIFPCAFCCFERFGGFFTFCLRILGFLCCFKRLARSFSCGARFCGLSLVFASPCILLLGAVRVISSPLFASIILAAVVWFLGKT